MHKGHCSGLIKVLPGYENVYAAHSRLVHFFKYMYTMYVYHICMSRSIMYLLLVSLLHKR